MASDWSVENLSRGAAGSASFVCMGHVLRCLIFGVLLWAGAGVLAAETPAGTGRLLYSDDFSHGLAQWVVEQQPGGTVTASDGALRIDDADGCTVWFRSQLEAPVVISYEARVLSAGRVSDLNCFWMASDPKREDDLFASGHQRDGRFATYDTLRTYYVGYGGNENTTTRFRRYDGTGAKPLAPENDRRAPEFLLKADHTYRIQLVATADGHVQFIRDGEVIFDVHDPAPLRRGWFGFRTVHSKMVIRNFQIHATAPDEKRAKDKKRTPSS
jgi:hypothetical protein